MLQLVPGLQGELVVKVARADALGPLMQDPDGSHNLPCRPHPGYQEHAERDDPVASHPGQVFSRAQLLDAVWDYEYAGDTSTVTVHMRRLRAKVEPDPSRPRHLKTVWGVGYKFEP